MEQRFELAELTPVGVPRQEQVVAVGRICCESSEGKINRASILLEVIRVALIDMVTRRAELAEEVISTPNTTAAGKSRRVQ